MAHQTLYQLGPTEAFTAAQRRELNQLLLRLSQELPRLLDDSKIPDLAAGATLAQTVTKLNDVIGVLRGLGLGGA